MVIAVKVGGDRGLTVRCVSDVSAGGGRSVRQAGETPGCRCLSSALTRSLDAAC